MQAESKQDANETQVESSKPKQRQAYIIPTQARSSKTKEIHVVPSKTMQDPAKYNQAGSSKSSRIKQN